MSQRHFGVLAGDQWRAQKFLCVGLDTEHQVAAEAIGQEVPDVQFSFNREIVDATHDLVGAYKLNSAFYEACGVDGIVALRATIAYIRDMAPNVPVIVDAKRADIGNTNSASCEFIFDYLGADAVTVHPYLGRDALEPFLAREDRGIFVLCRTSNPGADEFQDLRVGNGVPLFEVIAQHVTNSWNMRGNCGLVVGATYPSELEKVRSLAPTLPLLVPGVGAQGGDLEAAVRNGLAKTGGRLFVNSSRAIIFASMRGFRDAARSAAKSYDSAIRMAAKVL